jgi:hypothetical protein
MSNTEPLLGTFHDAITGVTVTRELTADEIALLPQPSESSFGEQSPVDVVDESVTDENSVVYESVVE